MTRYIACLLLALALPSCTKECNEMGCSPNSYSTLHLTSSLDAKQANHIRVEAADRVYECDLPSDADGCTSPSEVVAQRSGDQWTSFSLPAILEPASITITRGGAPTTREVTPTSENDYPNGEDCPPACPHPAFTL
jgi:hypothetical protein